MAYFRRALSSKALVPVVSIATSAVATVSVVEPSKDEHRSNGVRHLNWFQRASFVRSSNGMTYCDGAVKMQPTFKEVTKSDSNSKNDPEDPSSDEEENEEVQSVGFQANAVGDFHGMFPLRQLFQPSVPYPLWNPNWDGRQPVPTGDPEADKHRMRTIRKTGTTRHIILIRHGQYDETSKEDELRKLTPLGREQAHLTGERIAEMMRGGTDGFAPCKVRSLRVSAMTRARETADIIASHLDGVELAEPNPSFNEGRPCHTIPGGPASEKTIKVTDENHPRIEGAFRELFVRASEPGEDDTEQHEFEVIVCHANVIRYWMCRALQLPPEAWLRYCPFNCSLTYLTIRPTGSVSCRMLGDIGHLPYKMDIMASLGNST